ncbi:hypothetical protein JCM11251_005333 [Rhodosporidiobolus azoricus]
MVLPAQPASASVPQPVLSSPHLKASSLAYLLSVHQPDGAPEAYDEFASWWGRPSFERIVVPVDGVDTDVYLARGVLLPVPLLTRDEHIQLWRALQSLEGGSHGAVWGQPGAGKSFCLNAFTSICLEKKIPFARFVLGGKYVNLLIEVDTPDGPKPRLFAIPCANFARLRFTVPNYLFLDAAVAGFTVPSDLYEPGILRLTKVVLATSPQDGRDHCWAKEKNVQFAVMQLFSREEMQAVHAAMSFVGRHDPVSFEDVRPTLPSGHPIDGYSSEVIEADLKNPVTSNGLHWTILAALHCVGPDARRVLPLSARVKMSDTLEDDLLIDVKKVSLGSSSDEAYRSLAGTNPYVTTAKDFHLLFFETPILPASSSSSTSYDRSLSLSTASAGTSPSFRFARGPRARSILPTRPLLELFVQQIKDALENPTFDLISMLDGSGTIHGIVFEIAVGHLLSTRSSVKLYLQGKEPVTVILPASTPFFPHTWNPNNVNAAAPTSPGVYHLPTGFESAQAFLVASSPNPVSCTLPDTRLSRLRLLASKFAKKVFLRNLKGNPIEIVLQMTVSEPHTVDDQGVAAIKARSRNRSESGNREKRPLVFAFVAPRHEIGERLAWAVGSLEGFDEVGWIVLDQYTVTVR